MKPNLSTAVQCPTCQAVIDVPISVVLSDPDEGQQFIKCDPDLTDVWAHAWTHEE
jgi:hypothetical protein